MSALILTLGDPNGLGPQLAVRIPEERLCPKGDRLLMIGSEKPLLRHCQDAGRPPFWRRIGVDTVCAGIPPGIWLLEPEAQFEPAFGRATTNGGLVAGQSLELACTILSRKRDWALVTCPINKSTLNRAGFCFSGHTEFLAEYTKSGQKNVCMHLCGSRLRVSLVTTHPALKDVPGLINRERILKCLSLTRDFLIRLGAEQTRIAVCGLNPHAGEDGKIGDEEGRIIRPAVEVAEKQGIDAVGPLPGDTVFYHAARGEYGAVLAMYHDQGLAPLKLLHFKEAVNITLGLPFIRTSVDHGTGYDLVGSDRADPTSLVQALELASTLLAGVCRSV